ncbi:MAG TPA: hypothetical protein EYQ54_21205 [Myxococcales bacterium]|nr:hypothetical protein [Myxococcales bacterium]HIK86740.1 hypothetical protein [Myxococcales bacterium]
MNARGFNSPKRVAYAGVRLLGFFGVWIAAFTWLPGLPVGAALIAWIVCITPKVRGVSEEFQNIDAPPVPPSP